MTIDVSHANRRLGEILGAAPRPPGAARAGGRAGLDLSLIFFADANQQLAHRYQLVFDLAELADRHGFRAVWIPERHFHPFGGIYPDPAVLAAALAGRTRHVRLRSGSVVLPLHHPASVVESWAMVDHLSNGRVDLGFASGWNPNDFVTSPDTFARLREVWKQRIHDVRALWRGETRTFVNGKGEEVAIQTYPRPIQPELEVWLTVTKLDEGFQYAGAQGYNVLTMLQGIELDELGRKIGLYRQARRDAGLAPEGGEVTLMLHTLVHRDLQVVRDAVREPFFAYIQSALTGHLQGLPADQRPSERDLRRTVEYAYERYFQRGALFGSIDDAAAVLDKAISVGVTEVACLMDFGVPRALVLESLPYLAELGRVMARPRPAP